MDRSAPRSAANCLGEPVADVDRIDLHVAERVALDRLAGGLPLGDDASRQAPSLRTA